MSTTKSKHILLTGATGYIGKRLLPELLREGHKITCCVRDASRFQNPAPEHVDVLEIDFLDVLQHDELPTGFDAAYYLIHSMSGSRSRFMEREQLCALNFRAYANFAGVKEVIYLSGIAHEDELSPHLISRKNVEEILNQGDFSTTVLRAGIIVGSGSASFELIRDIVEKLPVMLTPRWIHTKNQPVAIRDVINALVRVLGNPAWQGKGLDIGGPEVLTYKEMLLKFGEVRGLKRRIFSLPFMSPRISSFWLFFMSSVSYSLASNLVDSMKVEVIPQKNFLPAILEREPIEYAEAVKMAFARIRSRQVVSSWKDAMSVESLATKKLKNFIQVPVFGVKTDVRKMRFPGEKTEEVLDRVFGIGGENGWYYGNWLWEIRGTMDKMVGGIGLRRGRTEDGILHPGDALDFWRVLLADRESKRLLLFAEMKLPGEAWLEFTIKKVEGEMEITQTATFRPRGLLGRIYWWSVLPFHFFIFRGMLRKIVEGGPKIMRAAASDPMIHIPHKVF